MVMPSDKSSCKGMKQRCRPQRTVNADVASSHATPVAETIDNVRRQQESNEMSLKTATPAGICSWRFWAKGANKKALVCGVARDSSDSVGRPYPLLVVGTGPLADWEDEWELLPAACENTWNQMDVMFL